MKRLTPVIIRNVDDTAGAGSLTIGLQTQIR